MLRIRHLIAILRSALVGAIGASSAYAQDPDQFAWEEAKAAGTRTAYEVYLSKFPAGKYHSEAFAAMIEASLFRGSLLPDVSNDQDLY